MAHDLKKMFAKQREKENPILKKGHEERFLSKLEAEMTINTTKKKSGFPFWLQVAASVILFVSLGIYFFNDGFNKKKETDTQIVDTNTSQKMEGSISLGDLSPDLKKIENYYLSNINLQLSDLEVDPGNKEVMDSFMERLAELDAEYRRLNQELNQLGPNDHTINALVKNLQLRLQLLQKLKSKLNQLKSSKNEQKSSHIV
ncbi:hypothetical protein GTQ34_00575 [Muricauda sp. JGD-17]|uniref:Anti-sigma factor n=1 Tax=Flagellimonas ochracea TaxID=2696472 RepID=A0A964WVY2_9FLAO|nr:hypothetical protein [Allomuricauda ochracea]NAY90400.1 hypothetical protein [Allomuricauda ochracea]